MRSKNSTLRSFLKLLCIFAAGTALIVMIVWFFDYSLNGVVLILALGPGDFTSSGHFVVVSGHTVEGFVVNDPNSIENSGRIWSYERLEGQISNLWSLEPQIKK